MSRSAIAPATPAYDAFFPADRPSEVPAARDARSAAGVPSPREPAEQWLSWRSALLRTTPGSRRPVRHSQTRRQRLCKRYAPRSPAAGFRSSPVGLSRSLSSTTCNRQPAIRTSFLPCSCSAPFSCPPSASSGSLSIHCRNGSHPARSPGTSSGAVRSASSLPVCWSTTPLEHSASSRSWPSV